MTCESIRRDGAITARIHYCPKRLAKRRPGVGLRPAPGILACLNMVLECMHHVASHASILLRILLVDKIPRELRSKEETPPAPAEEHGPTYRLPAGR